MDSSGSKWGREGRKAEMGGALWTVITGVALARKTSWPSLGTVAFW